MNKYQNSTSFKKGRKPTHDLTYWKGKKLSSEHRKKLSDAKKQFYAKHGNVIGFKKGNNLADNPNAVLSRFKIGQFSGEKHPNWNGGSSFEPYSLDWTQTLKRSIRERDRYTCQVCLKSQGDEAFCVHHINYDKKNCNPENLVTLCRGCHTKTNHSRDYWINYFNGKK